MFLEFGTLVEYNVIVNWNSGRVQCDCKLSNDSEWDHLTRHKSSGKETINRRKSEYHCDQIEYAAKLCELGFYKFDLREEKIKRIERLYKC